MKFILFEHIWIKIFAIIMGLLLWFHVATEKTYKHEINLPITEITLKANQSLAGDIPDSMTVIVNATGKQLLRKKWRSRGIKINATTLNVGRHNITLTTNNTFLFNSEDEVTLEEIISPLALNLTIDSKLEKKVKVVPNLDLITDQDFAVSEVSVPRPENITIVGPRSVVYKIDSVFTEYQTLKSLRNNITLTLPVIPPDDKHLSVLPDSVMVDITVVPVKTRIFESIPVVIFNSPPDKIISLEPSLISVELTGPPKDVDALNPAALIASVDFLELDSNNISPIKIETPLRFQIKSTSDSQVKVTVH